MAPSRTRAPLAGDTLLQSDENRGNPGACEHDSVPTTAQMRGIDEAPETLAIGRYARFSRASDTLIGGTRPHPDHSRMTTSWNGDSASCAIGRYARFSRESTRLVGGTQPQPDQTSEQVPLSYSRQPSHPKGESEFFTVRHDSPDSSSFNIPKATDRPLKARWLRPGEPVTIAGSTLPGGMLYIGTEHAEYRQSEPSFIDTSLPIASSSAHPAARLVFYWSTYKDLEPEARRGYLQWLAGGRCDPEVPSGYVFMFFHGLERRVLIDTLSEADAREDTPVIEEEINRLKALYRRDFSFFNQASKLLEYLNMEDISERMYLRQPPMESYDAYEMPMMLRVALGQMAIDKYPLNAAWALAWALTDPAISRGKPVARCMDLFQRLFTAEYEKQFPDGLKLPNNKARLWIGYNPSSPFLNVPRIATGDLPDVSMTSGTRKKLQLLVQACAAVLAPFSRYIGRNADNVDMHDALDALLLLPPSLWPDDSKHELQRLQSDVGTGAILMTLDELAARFNSDGAQARNQIVALTKILGDINIGMEPDVLAGSRAPKADDNIVLFATEPDAGMSRVTAAYAAAVVTLDLASIVIIDNGKTSQPAVAALEQHIDSWTHLSSAHRKRLGAYLLMQLQQPPPLASLKRKLGALTPDEKQAIVCCLTYLAHADGPVTPEQVRSLERIYKALQLDSQALYSDLHVAAASSRFATVSAGPAALVTTGSGIKKPGSGIVLDMNKIARLQRETAAVSALLADVFRDGLEEEQEDVQTSAEPSAHSASSTDIHLYGLDAGHSAFLRLLVSRQEWTRQALENATADMDLMLDGALEQINDMAFDLFDMPVSEGDDPIEINPDILSELTL
ncbi:tellurite resistance TerB family protein [Pseudomonas cannabina]|nr:TerB N-terminal domain-containing protein [Pseudomonas cannabina]MBM0138363.1 TerB N-terminal domain-containing protein [Pseudomonas cannabina pv. alisalensis]RMN89746.1 hypothetical protein ALQ51_03711 [Pseudomonas cannabina]